MIPFFSASKEVGVIREYVQGPNAIIMSVACGGYEVSAHLDKVGNKPASVIQACVEKYKI